eukprot:993410-Pleurochrysis_carterae.AAC.1
MVCTDQAAAKLAAELESSGGAAASKLNSATDDNSVPVEAEQQLQQQTSPSTIGALDTGTSAVEFASVDAYVKPLGDTTKSHTDIETDLKASETPNHVDGDQPAGKTAASERAPAPA